MKLYVDFLDKQLLIKAEDRHILKQECAYSHAKACFGNMFVNAYSGTGDNEDLIIKRYPHINDVETFANGLELICDYFSLSGKKILRLVYIRDNEEYAVVKEFNAAISRIGYQNHNKNYK